MFDRDIFKALISEIADTREVEIGCDECFEQLDSIAEAELSGVEARSVMPLVRDHLDKCADCHSTFEALLTALRGT